MIEYITNTNVNIPKNIAKKLANHDFTPFNARIPSHEINICIIKSKTEIKNHQDRLKYKLSVKLFLIL